MPKMAFDGRKSSQTLAAVESLDCLLYPAVPVYVPDAVLYEATVRSGALGAQSIAEWVQHPSQLVFPLVTRRTEDAGRFASRRATLAGQRERAILAVRRLLQGRSDTTKQ
jgi:hypothetical protein